MDSKYRDHEIDAKDRSIREGRVGLIVAGSLITGFVVALVLVIGPFGGAQEHVIMGCGVHLFDPNSPAGGIWLGG